MSALSLVTPDRTAPRGNSTRQTLDGKVKIDYFTFASLHSILKSRQGFAGVVQFCEPTIRCPRHLLLSHQINTQLGASSKGARQKVQQPIVKEQYQKRLLCQQVTTFLAQLRK
jgi:hypothetical protein